MLPVALFDFDETLIRENSLGSLFKAASGRRRLWPQAILAVFDPLCWRKGPRIAIKHRLYKLCLEGLAENQLYPLGEQVANKFEPVTEVQKALREQHDKGAEIWVVTASPELFIRGLLARLELPVSCVIGTRLPTSDGHLTGELTFECSGSEKIKRILSTVREHDTQVALNQGYGNLPWDREMLSLVSQAFVVRKGVVRAFSPE